MEKDTGITPAALEALVKGDLENALVAMTPGGIEAQEAQGQRDMIAASRLPKQILGNGRYEDFGIEILGEADDLFYNVKLPVGWRCNPTKHSMCSTLVDDKERERALVFYKAAFYDRRAHISFHCRYIVRTEYLPEGVFDQEEYVEPDGTEVRVLDTATGEVLHRSRTFPRAETRTIEGWRLEDEARHVAREWLRYEFPRYADPAAYWND